MRQKWEGDCGLWVLIEIILKEYAESLKKMWRPFGSCLLNSTANPAKLGWKWAGLAVLFSRQLLNGSHDLFPYFQQKKYISRLISDGIGGVLCL